MCSRVSQLSDEDYESARLVVPGKGWKHVRMYCPSASQRVAGQLHMWSSLIFLHSQDPIQDAHFPDSSGTQHSPQIL